MALGRDHRSALKYGINKGSSCWYGACNVLVIMKTSNVGLLLLAGSLASSIACSTPSAEPTANVEIVKSSLAREMSPLLTPSELSELSVDQADFAVDIYKAVRKSDDGNVFLSPHSISTALAMTYAGARGQTRDEMKKALHFGLPDDRLHRGFDYLDLALSSRGQNATGQDGKPFRLAIANSIWTQQGAAFEAPFLDTLAVNYGAGLHVVDFVAQTEPVRLAINGWVEGKTEDRIKDLIPERALTSDVRFVIVNAVYFNASWESKFEKEGTSDQPFTKLDGSTVQVSMMSGRSLRPYAAGDGYEAVEMPYDGGDTSMLVIAPTKGTFASFESSMTGGRILDVLAGLSPQQVVLSLPKVKLDANYRLGDSLNSLGMKSAFGPDADFTGISSTQGLFITKVLHKTFLAIDENGTEAAAATAVIGGLSSLPPKAIEMNVDRPYIVAIVDRQTKTLLFFGRIVEPKI